MKTFQNKRGLRKTCILLALLLITSVVMSACWGKDKDAEDTYKEVSGGVAENGDGGTGTSSDETDEKEQKIMGPTLDEIKERGYIIMGLDDTFAPMGFRDKQNNLVGFDVDLAKEVFKRAEIELKLQPIDWSMKETELNTGKIDVIWNGYTITPGRKEQVDFTKPYLTNKQIIVTMAGSGVDKREDLAGKKVAIQSESSAIDAVEAYPDVVKTFDGGKPVLFATNDKALMDLEVGRSDAVVGDEVYVRYYIKQKGKEKYKIAKEDFGDEEYGIGFRKTNGDLLKLIDDVLDKMREDGSYDEIYNKWFSDN
ncbi:MAG: amino acid ABC transporter substrate-binding protein [Natronincolaceae bacterium]|jgi:polar amino acid transport system substrate-binding protein|nr:amino acid ABC transporter substrate-binding protein [Bacillota bacterium]